MVKKIFERIKQYFNKKKIININIVNPVFQSPEMQKKAMDEIVNRVIENYKNNGKIREAMKGDM